MRSVYLRAARLTALAALILLAAYSTVRVIAIDAWLGQTVATRVDEAGRTVPLNRADALAYFLSRDVAAAHAQEAK